MRIALYQVLVGHHLSSVSMSCSCSDEEPSENGSILITEIREVAPPVNTLRKSHPEKKKKKKSAQRKRRPSSEHVDENEWDTDLEEDSK